ncbi:MAG: DUF4292 domain-containing protein [Ignavibacteria bacterium]|nr:DUF4292 domain-containing protein [Ignavibacteria bacterium]
MTYQPTMLLIVAVMLCRGLCVSQELIRVPDLAAKLGSGVHSIYATGVMSTTGEQLLRGIPVKFIITDDTVFCMTVGGPFGITAAQMYSQPDTFVLVNYLTRDAACGNPLTAKLANLMPVKLSISDLTSVMQGKVPGDIHRFSVAGSRNGSDVLLETDSDSVREFVLIDTAANVMKQYQRKLKNGFTEMNVSFGDIRVVDGFSIPHGIDVEVDNKSQTLSIRLDDVIVNGTEKPLTVVIPPSFSKTVYR